jgi:hypothetical protein
LEPPIAYTVSESLVNGYRFRREAKVDVRGNRVVGTVE